jgi:hypothetical protein
MITKELKQQIMKEYARTEGDTGSPEVQVAVLTERINELTAHLKDHPEGSSFQKRTSEDGRTEKKSSRISERQGHRALSFSD